jgi:hypothetical protein
MAENRGMSIFAELMLLAFDVALIPDEVSCFVY